MPVINLTPKTYFDLIELIVTFKNDFYNFVEGYNQQLEEEKRSNYKNDYLHENTTKQLYVKCIERLEICDRIVKELREGNEIN